MKLIAPDQLKHHSLCAELIDTHFTEWKDGERFELYRKRPRSFSGLLFVVSDVETVCTELDENGAVVRRISAKKGDILYLPKDIIYHSVFYCEKTHTCTLNFNLYDITGDDVLLDNHILLLNNKVNPFMTQDLENIHRIFHNPIASDKLNLNSLFFSILYYATRRRGESKVAPLIKLAVQAIENEYDQNKPIETYAQLCNLSPTYFYREFRAYAGMTPIEYRNSLRINVAKSDLHNTEMTIKEIAQKVGIYDEFYFSRLFKRITGMSPKKFKLG